MRYDDIPPIQHFRWHIGRLALGGHRRTGPTIGRNRSNDSERVLDILCELLEDYKKAGFALLSVMDVLGQLYYSTAHYLKHPSRQEPAITAVEALADVTKRKLCEIFGCGIEELPDEMVEYFGQKIDEGAHEEDINALEIGGAKYLTEAKAEKFKLKFHAGVAYMWDWYSRPESLQRVRAHTANVRSKVITAGMAGYVLCPGNTIYMGRHWRTWSENEVREKPKKKFSHSAYLAGKPVLCAGEIAIVEGSVKIVTNSSGHYKPEAAKLLHVLRCLRLNGINLTNLLINARTNDDSHFYAAEPFLRSNGDLKALARLDKRQEKNLFVNLPGWIEISQWKYKKMGLSQDEIILSSFPGVD